MLGDLRFARDAAGKLRVWGMGDKIVGRVGFMGFLVTRSSIVSGHECLDLLQIVFRSSHVTLGNGERNRRPERVI